MADKGSVTNVDFVEALAERNIRMDDCRHRAHNNSGVSQLIVLHDGHVCGNCKPFSKSL
ncbi:MAG: hypothetical protein IIW44_08560 [Alistipes sp.]|nr:hypothetical protein [Alistipes sp.]